MLSWFVVCLLFLLLRLCVVVLLAVDAFMLFDICVWFVCFVFLLLCVCLFDCLLV